MLDRNKNIQRDELPITAWSPLRHALFRSLWIASVVSNTGTWIQSTATAWLMTSLAPSAIMVSLVQTATTLPLFLLALPAGALADVIDRRRLIIVTQGWMLLSASLLGLFTIVGVTTPWVLLSFTLLLSLGSAMNAPAWQAIVPELVSHREIAAAVALNSAGFNAARAVGPALGGIIVGGAGAGSAFIVNAVSYLGVMVVLFLWQRPPRESTLPAERIIGAIKTGIRYVRYAPCLRAILIRTAAFTLCASAQMALLPLFARNRLGVSSTGYGLLLGAFGVGAVAGAAILPSLRSRVSVDALAILTTVLFALSLLVMPFIEGISIACAALFLAGVAWLMLLSTFNGSVQAVVPAWVRGRVMAIYMLTFFGGMALGSTAWGAVASATGMTEAFILAAVGLLAGLGLSVRYRLATFEQLDLRPSMHWPVPNLLTEPAHDDGPVLVRVEYRIDPAQWREFGLLMRQLRNSRLRGGAFRWTLFVDAADPEHYVESFIVESWIEHLRQHERVTVADLELEKKVRALHKGDEMPVVTHLLAKQLPEEPE